MKKVLFLIMLAPAILLLSGCAAIGTAVSHAHLETQTLMSESVFLPPDSNPKDKTIYLQVRNTSDKQSVSLAPGISAALQAKGYQVVSNVSNAHYILQVNLLQIGRNSITSAKEMMGSGYGGAVEGAVSGVVVGAIAGGNLGVTGLVGGVAGTVVDSAVKSVTYSGITDIKITVQPDTKGGKSQVYTTRILSTANQVNLDFPKASPFVQKGLVSSIAGLF